MSKRHADLDCGHRGCRGICRFAVWISQVRRAAENYEGDKAGIYEMCKADYPDILAELEKEPWDMLLDAGCGPAPMITLLSEKYPDRHYTGIDLTPRMIEQAKKKKIPNAEFVVGDCENLPFADNSFDVAKRKSAPIARKPI